MVENYPTVLAKQQAKDLKSIVLLYLRTRNHINTQTSIETMRYVANIEHAFQE